MKTTLLLSALLAAASASPTAAADPVSACVAKASFDDILHGSWDYESLELIHSLEHYYACLSLAAGSESECGPLKTVRPSPGPNGRTDLYNYCRKAYVRMRLAHDLITRSPKLVETLRMSASTRHGRPQAEVEEMAREVSRHADDPAKACPALAKYFEKFPSDCLTFMGIQSGRLDCATLDKAEQPHMEPERFLCAAGSAFRKAVAGGGPPACGGNPGCLTLLGGGASSCRPLGEAAKKLYCEARLKPAAVPSR